jgi:hypothetical protein
MITITITTVVDSIINTINMTTTTKEKRSKSHMR